ncbi:hypothetical protein NKI50_30250 [Mesorhizobium sp. M0563]|uniref:hypothetical protein n=1 Tax=Mesorhizobium sp. M0563 TaxID=2956959 RepID=UPI0033397D84
MPIYRWQRDDPDKDNTLSGFCFVGAGSSIWRASMGALMDSLARLFRWTTVRWALPDGYAGCQPLEVRPQKLVTFHIAPPRGIHVATAKADWCKSLCLLRHYSQVRWIKNSTAIERSEELTFDRHPALKMKINSARLSFPTGARPGKDNRNGSAECV